MAFEDQLRRTFDQLIAELTDASQAERDRARAAGVDEGRAQGWEDGREQGRFEGRQEAETEHANLPVAVVADPEPDGRPERLLDAVRAIDRARTLSDILDTLAACAGREASRAAVLLVRDGELRGWRFIGFDPSFANGSAIEIPLRDAGVIADAIERVGAATADAPARFAASDAVRAYAMPVAIAGDIVAVVYADDPADGEPPIAGDAAIEVLARHASRAIEAHVAFAATRMLAEPVDAPPAAAEADDAEASARRYAKLLVSEIKLYHEPAVVAGRRDRDLATRLGGEIARARVLYEQRVPSGVRQRSDYFRDELVRTLANGDPTLLQLT